LNFLTVTSNHLERLDSTRAVEIVRRLLVVEAHACGARITAINVPGDIFVSDGGIDAEAEGISGSVGLLQPGYNRFQIKTGDFDLHKPSKITELLFDGKGNKRKLKPRVQACLEHNGTFTVVVFGWDKPDRTDESSEKGKKSGNAVAEFRRQLSDFDSKYSNAKIEVCRQNNLITYLHRFPSLALEVNGNSAARFVTVDRWSTFQEMDRSIHLGGAQLECIESIRSSLLETSESVHVRVIGEPGVGKTRLVLETILSSTPIKALTLYCSRASEFIGSDLQNLLLGGDSLYNVILVLDECNGPDAAQVWDRLYNLGPRVKLVTITHWPEQISGQTRVLRVPALDRDQIRLILKDYVGLPQDAERWVEFCGGSPRVAHLLGNNLRINPDDLLASPDTVDAWGRFIAGPLKPSDPEVAKRKLVLCHLALFQKFGFEPPLTDEAKKIHELIQKTDVTITFPAFSKVVRELRELRILQGETTLYITPPALQIKYWTDWWEDYGDSFNLEEFTSHINPKMLQWFYSTFEYAQESLLAARTVQQLLRPDGPFATLELLETPLGGGFFFALTNANPEAALSRLKSLLGNRSREELLLLGGRRKIIESLERIVVWKPLFLGAARILLALAEAENERWTNNASGLFANLFSLGIGQVAPTEAEPSIRFLVLQEALSSTSAERRKLGLAGLGTALEIDHFSKFGTPEWQGLRKEPALWTPQTNKELFDAYRQAMKILHQHVTKTNGKERQESIEVFINQMPGLLRIEYLREEVLSYLEEFCNLADKTTRMSLLNELSRLLLHTDFPDDVTQRLKTLVQLFEPQDFSSRLRRWVGTGLFADRFDQVNGASRMEAMIKGLAEEVMAQPEILTLELEWLAGGPQNGFAFGYALAQQDLSYMLYEQLLSSLHTQTATGVPPLGNAFCLSGYLAGMRQREPERWEAELDRFCDNSHLQPFVAEVTWRTGLNDRIANRLLELAKQGLIDSSHFALFRFTQEVQYLSQDVLDKWIDHLTTTDKRRDAFTAVYLIHIYYKHQDSTEFGDFPQALILGVLKACLAVDKLSGPGDSSDDYYWTQLGLIFVERFPENSIELGHIMLQQMGDKPGLLSNQFEEAFAVLNAITRSNPAEMWEITSAILLEKSARGWHIQHWLRGNSGFGESRAGTLRFIPAEQLWAWVDLDIKLRAKIMASIVPNHFMTDTSSASLTRELLIRYGDRDDVKRSLRANFGTEGWSGSASDHYSSNREALKAVLMNETAPQVIDWVETYIADLSEQIQTSKMQEEREG
jgi:hypothetical protein